MTAGRQERHQPEPAFDEEQANSYRACNRGVVAREREIRRAGDEQVYAGMAGIGPGPFHDVTNLDSYMP